MSKFHLNINFSWAKAIKQTIIIILSVASIWAYLKFFPAYLVPKDFVFKTLVFMLIYVLVALIVESIYKAFSKKESKPRPKAKMRKL